MFQHTELYPSRLLIYPFQNLSLGFILKIFLKFRKFQPQYSYKTYSYKKKKKKSVLKDPCGRSSFQETIKIEEQKNPRNIADQATTGTKICKNKIGEAANRENAEEANGQCNNVRRLSFRKQAWAEIVIPQV